MIAKVTHRTNSCVFKKRNRMELTDNRTLETNAFSLQPHLASVTRARNNLELAKFVATLPIGGEYARDWITLRSKVILHKAQ